VAFIGGAAFAGNYIGNYKDMGKKPRYILVTSIKCLFFFLILLLSELDSQNALHLSQNAVNTLIIFFLSFCCGVQNSTCALSTNGFLKPTHMTGLSTDIGINLIKHFPFKKAKTKEDEEAKKKNMDSKALVGSSNESLERKPSACDLSNHELDRRTKRLCLQPRVIERILPLVLMHSNRGGLVFLLSKVLSGISLKEILQNREELILKELVWALGSDTEIVGSVLQAIKVAATALLSKTKRSLSSDDSNDKDPSLASQWVTSHFMYLLVNVIQYRWKARTKKEQLQALTHKL
jgi:hypothetical protein